MFQKPDYQSQMSRPPPDICQSPDVEDGGGYLLPNSKSGQYPFFMFAFVKKNTSALDKLDDLSKGKRRTLFSSAPSSNSLVSLLNSRRAFLCGPGVLQVSCLYVVARCDAKWVSDKTCLTAARPKQQELEGVTTTYPSPAPLISRKRPWTTADI